MIPVSQPFLPPKDEYIHLISALWESKWLTNNGMYVQRLERQLTEYLAVPSLHYVNNGTSALQIAIKLLNIKGEVITTPFSFVATTTSIIWENCQPVFVDIDPQTLCIDANKIEAGITSRTEAILATHVYGIPCDVEAIEKIARKYNLKVIYDGAHAFGVQYKGKALLSYGDLSILSFHATKLFHTIEGGGIVNNLSIELESQIPSLRNFGLQGESPVSVGINAKNSEFHAAMGICNLVYIDEIIAKRKEITRVYDSFLAQQFRRPLISKETQYNYSYYPIIFETEEELLDVKSMLEENKILARRYFYPSLNTLSYIKKPQSCPISEDISKRILCLPLYSDLKIEDAEKISRLIIRRKQSEFANHRRIRFYRL